MRVLYHLLLDQINPMAHDQLLADPRVQKLKVTADHKFRHGQQVTDMLINGRWLSDTVFAPDPTTKPNAVIVRSDWPDLAWLLLQTQGL